jgi:hypothetical protein
VPDGPPTAPVPPPAHRTGRADLPHPARRRDSDVRPAAASGGTAFTGHVVPAAVAESLLEGIGNRATLPTLDHCQDAPEVRPLPSTGITRRGRYYEPVRQPPTARPVPRGRPVRATATVGASRVACVFPVQTCPRPYPGGTVARIGFLPGQRRRRPSPKVRWIGCRSRIISRPARRSRMFWPACSRGRLTRPFPSKASAVLLPPLPLRLLLAGATVARWDLYPLKNDALERRTDIVNSLGNSPGGPGWLPTQGSHRSVHAPLTHTARQGTASLTALAEGTA